MRESFDKLTALVHCSSGAQTFKLDQSIVREFSPLLLPIALVGSVEPSAKTRFIPSSFVIAVPVSYPAIQPVICSPVGSHQLPFPPSLSGFPLVNWISFFRWSSLTVSQANHSPWSVLSSCIDVSFISRAQLFSAIIPRKFNSDKKKEKDNLSRTRKRNNKTLLAAREAAIAYFARVDAIAAEEAAAVEVAAIEVVDVVVEEPADDAAVALVIDIADQHSRPRLSDFVPPPTSRHVVYRPYDRWPSPEEPPTPPGEPESEDFIPNLSDCEVRCEVGPSSDDEAPEPTSPPPPTPPSPLRRGAN
ncbi:hypothetical protein DAPPUDRAFT_249852 [Daphnia pulex]|uniref:Uncharacterized protein n=1 Tax=Daphnia pulex TaxID=6669 RepID=E9GXE0_DAPPU|nr:hypothetical protein DAPPUDRAFT_249852 [Daphnia pulex]|eukprot:EFX75874.1 hypothetical protein DAPPUDRAFT_249852 [Daphnia pulex]